jgi:hypothetical protein
MGKSGKVIAKWDTRATKIYTEICVEEVNAGNKPEHFLNAKGYANLIRNGKHLIKGQQVLVETLILDQSVHQMSGGLSKMK